MYSGQNLKTGNVGNETIAQGIERLVLDDDRARASGHKLQESLVEQLSGKCGNKGGDSQLRNEER